MCAFGCFLGLLVLLGTFGYVGYFWLLLGMLGTFGYFWVLLNSFGYFWVLLGTFVIGLINIFKVLPPPKNLI